MSRHPQRPTDSSVDLYWLPLGAGDASGCVRWSGRIFETLAARHERREPCDLYHSALEVHLGGERFVVEMAPAWGNKEAACGVVGEGAVGLPWLGRSRLFRYEVRRWRNGVIPDVSDAVARPQRLSANAGQARQVLDLVPSFQTVTWGRDELDTGEMWNSNSLISWLLACTGHDVAGVTLPEHGRAPGWSAGVAIAARDAVTVLDQAASAGVWSPTDVGGGFVAYTAIGSGRNCATTSAAGTVPFSKYAAPPVGRMAPSGGPQVPIRGACASTPWQQEGLLWVRCRRRSSLPRA